MSELKEYQILVIIVKSRIMDIKNLKILYLAFDKT